jgi:predicted glycosyltransferase
MRIWIDITNSPHALFFDPIIRDLREAGHEVSVTARDYAQTVDLLAQKGIDYSLIGRHRGAHASAKALGLASRSVALISYARGKRFDVAFSHNSNDLAVAAWSMRIPHLVVHDYEHAKTSYAVNARLATRILVPEAIPSAAIVAHGARPDKVGHFPGLKEHVYLGPDTPREDLRESLGVSPDQVLAVLRPPATMSAYHLGFGNELFSQLISVIGERSDVAAVLVPRTKDQAAELAPTLPANVRVPEGVLDGPSLISSADLVVSAGGTMNREAAVLGTPAYTVFAGQQGAVDSDLIRRGLLIDAREVADVKFVPKSPASGWIVENRAGIIDELYRLARR